MGKVKVQYLKEVTGKKEDNSLKPIYDDFYTINNHTKRFHNCIYILAQLNMCSRLLMDFLCEEMNNDNIVSVNKYSKEKFVGSIKRESGEKYSIESVDKALALLKEKGLIKPESRGTYMVNPVFFFKGDDKKRYKLIQLILNFSENKHTTFNIKLT